MLAHPDVLLGLRIAGHDRGQVGERAPLLDDGPAEEEPGDEAVPGDVPVEVEDVAGLLAPEDAALGAQGLEHVAVAHVGGEDADAALAP